MTQTRLQPLAVARGYDIAKLARRADLGYRTVFDLWHNPGRDVTLGTLDKLAAALGVTVADLLLTEGQP